ADITAFSLSPSILRVLPVALSPTHTSIPAAVAFVNTNCFPSGLQCGVVSLGFAGNSTLMGVPSGTLRSSSEDSNVVLWSPLVLGLMRKPASRSMGSASSAMGGYRTGRPSMEYVRGGFRDSAGVVGE